MKRDTIVFTGTYSYLSNPQYFAIVPNLSEYKKIYLNANEPGTAKFDIKSIDKDELLKYFDSYHELEYIDINRKGFLRRY